MHTLVSLLTAPRAVTSVGVECLENMRSWIFFPKEVEISTSLDGQQYTSRWTIRTDRQNAFPDVRERQSESIVHNFEAFSTEAVNARYVRIKAVNYGKMPDWHVSAGQQAWLFADEVTVNWFKPQIGATPFSAKVPKAEEPELPEW